MQIDFAAFIPTDRNPGGPEAVGLGAISCLFGVT
jgi:hypothetical protein